MSDTKGKTSTPHEHKKSAPVRVGIQIITVTDTRDAAQDRSGAALTEIFVAAGHDVRPTVLVKDDAREINAAIGMAETDDAIRAIVLNGGTGVARRDVTIEAVTPLLEKILPGFGELFRMLSWEEIGAAALLSRAIAGTRGRRILFALPGSTAAVRLAAEKLIVPELGHLVRELDK